MPTTESFDLKPQFFAWLKASLKIKTVMKEVFEPATNSKVLTPESRLYLVDPTTGKEELISEG
jgi:hypothetical protein